MFSGMFQSNNNTKKNTVINGNEEVRYNVPKNNNTMNGNNGKAIVPFVPKNNNTMNGNNAKAIVPQATNVQNTNGNRRKNNNSNSEANVMDVYPSPFNLNDKDNAQALKNALKQTTGEVKAKRILNNMEMLNITDKRNIKTLDGNKVYYKKDIDGLVRPIIIFIKAASDSLNKNNLNVLSNVLAEKMPIRNANGNGYMFSMSGPFGSGYYHNGYFTKDNEMKWMNNPMFENQKSMKFGNLVRKLNTLKNNQNGMRPNVPNNIFNEYTKSSKENRMANLSKVVNKLRQ